MGIAESFFCKKFEVRIYLRSSEIFLISHEFHEFSRIGERMKVFIYNYLTNFHLTVNYNALLYRTKVIFYIGLTLKV